MGGLGQQPREQGEEEGDRDHCEREPDRRPGRADLEQLGVDLSGHGVGSEVRLRKMSSSEEPSATSSWIGTPAANARSPTFSLLTPCTSNPCSFTVVASIRSCLSACCSFVRSGVRTRTDPPTRAVSCSSEDSMTSFPWLMIST